MDRTVSTSESLFTPSFQLRFLVPFSLANAMLLAGLGIWLTADDEPLGFALLGGSVVAVLVALLSKRVQQRRLDGS